MKISIVTAVYNRERTIGEALVSVASQTYTNIEHVVIDGASRDGTLAVVRAHPDPRVVFVSEPDEGIYDALNKGIRRATGNIVGLMHSDDLFAHPEVLEKVSAAFNDPGVDIVYGDLVYVAASDVTRVVRHWRAGEFSPARLRQGWMPPHPTVFARARVFAEHGLYDTSYRIAADYEAMLRYFGRAGLRAAYIPEVLVRMRTGGASNRSLRHIMLKSREDLRALRSNGVGGLGTLAAKNLSKIPQFFVR